MNIVAGLGNPGVQYRDSRHNIGFTIVDMVAERLGAKPAREKFGGLVAEAAHAGGRVLLVKPLTFMNNSGECVVLAVKKRGGASPANLLVIVDDVNLPFAKIRLRAGGGAGGHKGLKSIIEGLGSDAFPRLRIGVGENKTDGDMTRHVLGKFTPEERDRLGEVTPRAVDAVLCFIEQGIERAMEGFN